MQKQSFSSIARELGVSTAVVSNVLRNTSTTTLASHATKQRILTAAWEKGLRLNTCIGVIVPQEVREHEALFYPGFAGITERCAQLGFTTSLLVDATGGSIPDFLKLRSVCGIIFWNDAPHFLLEVAKEEKIPFVLLNPQQDYEEADSISFNNYAMMYELLRYLYQRSYRRYIFLSSRGAHYITEQQRAFLDFLKEKKVTGKLFEDFEKQLAEVKDLVLNSNMETVFITFFRYGSIKLLEYFAQCSKSIPADGGIVASNLLADFYIPKLTAILNPYYESGSRAVDVIAEKWKTRQFYLNCHIVLEGKIIKNPSTEGAE